MTQELAETLHDDDLVHGAAGVSQHHVSSAN